jgi:membrane associated rhomboid family serine protease
VRLLRGPTITTLLALTIVLTLASVASWTVAEALALVPARVWRGEVWRLATWVFVETSPLSLVYGCVTIWWFGGDLLTAWSRAHFIRYLAGVVLVAAAGTCVLAWILPGAWFYPKLGGMALGDALVIAWALQFPYRKVIVHRVLAIGGDQLAYATLAMTVLFAIFYSVTAFVPELIAATAALAYMKKPRLPRRQPPRRRERGPYA